ncbi:hypothetical protein HDV00_012091 [Rhizophlyctis rosea]|nr:hypothetical protein HDV00_012091 [Rhizophlyctis rosea]
MWSDDIVARPQKFNEHQLFVIPLAGRVTSILSVIGTISLITAYFFFPSTRKTGSRPVIFMCMSSCMAATATCFGRLFIQMNSWPLCTLQAFTFQTFYLAGVCWSCAVASSLILVVRFRVDPSDLSRYPELRVYLFFVPMWVIFVFNISTYSYVGITLWRAKQRLIEAANNSSEYISSNNQSGNNVTATSYPPASSNQASGSSGKARRKWDQTVQKYVNKTALYLIAFLITWTPGTVNRIQNLIAPNDPWYWLFVVHAFFLPGGGFIESCIYFYPVIAEACQNRRREAAVRKHRANSTLLIETESRSSQRSLTRTIKDQHESPESALPRTSIGISKSEKTYPLYAVNSVPAGRNGIDNVYGPAKTPPPTSPIPPPPRSKTPTSPGGTKPAKLRDRTYKDGWFVESPTGGPVSPGAYERDGREGSPYGQWGRREVGQTMYFSNPEGQRRGY